MRFVICILEILRCFEISSSLMKKDKKASQLGGFIFVTPGGFEPPTLRAEI